MTWLVGILSAAVLQLPILPPLPLPPPPIPCIPLPLPPPVPCAPPSAPPGDEYPELEGLVVEKRMPNRALLSWESATDDRGILGFRIYRNERFLGSRGPKATTVKVFIPCGRHAFWVQAVDTANQGDSESVSLRRHC